MGLNEQTARERFMDAVDKLMDDRDCSYTEAWKLAIYFNPALYAEMQGGGERTASSSRIGQGPGEIKHAGHEMAYAAAARLANATQQRTKEALSFVNERMERFGEDYTTAFCAARKLKPQLFANDGGAVKAELIEDGQMLVPDGWPVPPQVLFNMGLPTNATREQYEMYKLADSATITPEIAAYVLRACIQCGQLNQGGDFAGTFDVVQKHFPDLFSQLKDFKP
jgi:hypothetical protein